MVLYTVCGLPVARYCRTEDWWHAAGLLLGGTYVSLAVRDDDGETACCSDVRVVERRRRARRCRNNTWCLTSRERWSSVGRSVVRSVARDTVVFGRKRRAVAVGSVVGLFVFSRPSTIVRGRMIPGPVRHPSFYPSPRVGPASLPPAATGGGGGGTGRLLQRQDVLYIIIIWFTTTGGVSHARLVNGLLFFIPSFLPSFRRCRRRRRRFTRASYARVRKHSRPRIRFAAARQIVTDSFRYHDVRRTHKVQVSKSLV